MPLFNTHTYTHSACPTYTHVIREPVPLLVGVRFLLQLSPEKVKVRKLPQFSLKMCKVGRGLAEMMASTPGSEYGPQEGDSFEEESSALSAG